MGPVKLFTQYMLNMVKNSDVSLDGALTIKLFHSIHYSKFGSKQSKTGKEGNYDFRKLNL